MTTAEYEAFVASTNRYPAENLEACLVMGLASEAGELCGVVKKRFRDAPNEDDMTFDEATAAIFNFDPSKELKELGDVLWYVTALANEYGVTLQTLMHINVEKLRGRLARGTIHGSGDDR